ncbi:hypothetical protein ACWC09_26500 [Streptomyces sp. NPDC001617]
MHFYLNVVLSVIGGAAIGVFFVYAPQHIDVLLAEWQLRRAGRSR